MISNKSNGNLESPKGSQFDIVEFNLRKYCNKTAFEVVFANEVSCEASFVLNEIVTTGKTIEDLIHITFITFEDIINFVSEVCQDSITTNLANEIKLFSKEASEEAMICLNSNIPMPTILMAKLIKVKLIDTINKQYTEILNSANRYEQLQKELLLLSKCESELNVSKNADSTTKKSKQKGDDSKKKEKKKTEKSSDSKKKQTKRNSDSKEVAKNNEEVVEIQLSEDNILLTSSFVKEVWFYVLKGFYDPNLLTELININVPISAVVEINQPQQVGPCENQTRKDENDINELDIKTQLKFFWNTLDDLFFGELRSVLLENTALLKYVPSNVVESTNNYRQYLLEFIGCLNNIYDLKLKHINYINKLRLVSVDHHNDDLCDQFQVYHNILEEFPFECLNIPVILNCLLDAICSSIDSSSSSDVIAYDPYEQESDVNYYVTEEKCKCPFSINNVVRINDHELSLDYHPKNFENNKSLKSSSYQIHEANDLEQLLKSYKQSGRTVYDTSLYYLKEALPANIVTELSTVFTDYYHFHDRSNSDRTTISFTKEELFHYIAVLILCKLPCHQNSYNNPKVYDLYLKTNNEQEYYNSVKCNVIDADEQELDDKSDSTHSSLNLYDRRAITNYNWAENLTTAVMLQELSNSNNNYHCIDYTYCDEIGALLVRYHDNLDKFGLNTKIWNQSLRTPICIRDFCRYVCSEDSEWILKEDEESVDSSSNTEKLGKSFQLDQSESNSQYINLITPDCWIEMKQKRTNSVEILNSIVNYPKSIFLKEHCGNNEDFSFVAYDLESCRIGISGSTTTFQSQDNVKIIIDTTHFFGNPTNLTITLTSDGTSLTIHREISFLFRLITSEGCTIVINKPLLHDESSTSVSNKGTEHSSNDSNKEESSRSQEEMLEKTSYSPNASSKISFKRSQSETKNQEDKTSLNSFNEHLISILQTNEDIKNFITENEISKLKKCDYEILSGILNGINSKASIYKIKSNLKNKEMLYRKLIGLKVPAFRVIKRILTKKSAKNKGSKKVKRTYVPNEKNEKHNNTSVLSSNSDFNMLMPHGLQHILIPSNLLDGFKEVKQQYVFGSHPPNIELEVYRIFTRNGFILIRYSDGQIKILKTNGEIVHFEKTLCKDNCSKDDTNCVTSDNNCLNMSSCKTVHDYQKKLNKILCRKYDDNTNNFPSRSAHKRKQKLNSFKSDDDSCDLPYSKYSILTLEGDKITIQTNKTTSAQEYLLLYEFDHRTEERFYIRDDGLRCLQKKDGTLCIQFPDRSRISSWYVIDDDLIYIIHSMGGWVSVVLNYKFEHPNYSTVIYQRGSDDITINPTKNLFLTRSFDDKFEVRIKNKVYSLDNDYLSFKKSCSDCESTFKCDVDIYKFVGINSDAEKNILVVKDSYNKVFQMHDVEKYSINKNYIKGYLNIAGCNHHSDLVYEKLFAVKNDLSGVRLWDNNNVQNKIQQFEKDDLAKVSLLTNVHGFNVAEFTKNFFCKYNQRFINFYLYDNICLLKHAALNSYKKQIVFMIYSEIWEIVDTQKTMSMFLELEEFILSSENHEVIGPIQNQVANLVNEIMENIKRNEPEATTTSSSETEEYPSCDCLKLKFTYEEKLDYWKKQCHKYRNYLRTPFIPLYFISEYYNQNL